jgi:hypothetical protein
VTGLRPRDWAKRRGTHPGDRDLLDGAARRCGWRPPGCSPKGASRQRSPASCGSARSRPASGSRLGGRPGPRRWPPGGASGQRCNLSPQCREKLADYLEQGPTSHGWEGPGVDWGAGGDADRQEVSRLLQRLGCDEADATDRVHAAGPGPQGRGTRREGRHLLEGGDMGGGKPPGRPAAAGSASRTRRGSPAGRRPDIPGDGAASPRS